MHGGTDLVNIDNPLSFSAVVRSVL